MTACRKPQSPTPSGIPPPTRLQLLTLPNTFTSSGPGLQIREPGKWNILIQTTTLDKGFTRAALWGRSTRTTVRNLIHSLLPRVCFGGILGTLGGEWILFFSLWEGLLATRGKWGQQMPCLSAMNLCGSLIMGQRQLLGVKYLLVCAGHW